MKLVEITPLQRKRLYGAMVKKEAEIRKKRAGAFQRAGARKRDKVRWRHVKFPGWIDLERGQSEVVAAKVSSDDWQLLVAFIGWVDRHFGDQLQAMSIQYR
jgi:hypothetical protein